MFSLDVSGLEASIGYVFTGKELLVNALTHTSYANEAGKGDYNLCNQRLEFLGDSVLSIIVSQYMFGRFPDMHEGKLSKLRAVVVCEKTLSVIARDINLGQYLLLGKGEKECGGADKDSILADAVEAVLAAVFLDSDFQTVTHVLMDNLKMRALIEESFLSFEKKDYKTILQEHFGNIRYSVEYVFVSKTGPDHDPKYSYSVKVSDNGTVICEETGSGRSIKDAEQNAAYLVLKNLNLV